MLLTASSGRDASLATGAPLLLLRAVAHRVVELLGLVDGRRLELRPHDVANRLAPVGDDIPLFAVPLLDAREAVALWALAGHAERAHHAPHASLLEALVGAVALFAAPAHLLAGE